jgi:hypothetical protein
MPVVVAIIASLILATLAVYQVVLLVGVPLARFAWGGEDHYLQPQFRLPAIGAFLLYVVAIVTALAGSDVIRLGAPLASQVVAYAFAAAFFAAFVLTARSRSPLERRLMLPVNVVLSGLFLIIAIAGHVRA